MRLNDQQRLDLVAALKQIFPETEGRFLIYGSRAQDHLKGGDIDLCFITENDNEAQNLQEKIVSFLMAAKKRIGEQKIDFSIISKSESLHDPFWKIALGNSKELFSQRRG